MKVTLLCFTIETALSSQVISSGQYNTYVCSTAVDVNVRMMYNPDLKKGSAPVADRRGTSHFRSLYIRRKISAMHQTRRTHISTSMDPISRRNLTISSFEP